MADATNETAWITGLGLATPLGCSFSNFTDAIMAGKSGIRPITTFDTKDHPTKIGGVLDPLRCPAGWDADNFECHDPRQQLLLFCALNALADAGLADQRSEARCGLVVGLGAEWMVTWESDMRHGGKRIWEPHTNGEGHLRFVQDQLQLRGPAMTVAAACASGNIALNVGRQWIRRGWVDFVLAGASERPISPMGVGCFSNLGALSRRNDQPTAASRPFDKDRDGFVLSEGAAFFLLESATSARRRGAKVYGEIAGFGAASDAFHLVSPSNDATHGAEAIRQALRDAQVCADEIDYVNAHATSTQVGDLFEAQALTLALGDAVNTIPVSATKSMTGHMVAAASAVEAAVCLGALARQAVPPTINLDQPDSQCRLCHVAKEAQPRPVKVAVSNSFGFGGSNTCLVLRQAG